MRKKTLNLTSLPITSAAVILKRFLLLDINGPAAISILTSFRKVFRIGAPIYILLTVTFIIALENTSDAGIRPFRRNEINTLVQKLTSDDLPEPYLRKLFRNPSFKKISRASRLNITKPVNLTHDRYKHFLEPYAIKKAKKFLQTWRTVLKNTEKKFGVGKHVIVSVLLVETGLGKIKGGYLLPSVFASIYIDAENIARTANRKISKKSLKKRAWALKQLKILLGLEKKGTLNVFRLKGSYAGAFGLPQFLPSSYARWAVRYQGTGTPNLFWEPDAISSLANYLKGNGYTPENDEKGNRKAIWAYNHSNVYVDTVLGVASILNNSR